MDSQIIKIKRELEEIISTLPENKLASVVDFARYLKEGKKEFGEESNAILKMQMSSKSYKEWISSDNDIYDELFKDEIE